ncbi:MAG: nitrous oxide reductase accessory protein NosL [Magnetococcales bacterium]|nr:nitrous oxide reductase accessory protein NosL [Magnetococcales bacterium]
MGRLMPLLLVLTLLVSACGNPRNDPPPAPLEPAAGTTGFYCGMALSEHPGPKGQIHVAGESAPLWFSSVRDALAYLQLEGATRRIRAFYVHDMGRADWKNPQPGTWIAAEKAHFVLDSRRAGGMGQSEVIPFGTLPQAEGFAREYGGRVIDHTTLRQMEMFPAKGDPGASGLTGIASGT